MEYKGKLYAKVNGKYIECTETVQQLESRIKELENNTTELIEYIDDERDFCYKTKCCDVQLTVSHNFCPNCGRKIIRN